MKPIVKRSDAAIRRLFEDLMSIPGAQPHAAALQAVKDAIIAVRRP
jgi:hypothetical protein